ncbi:unnamed protein product [Absidia cylindrospora]
MKLTTATLLASLASAALAFESTVPCLVWSSNDKYLTTGKNDQLILKNSDASSAILQSLSADVCGSHVIAIIDQPGLHRSDLASLDSVKKQIQSAASYEQFEYVVDGVDIDGLATSIANKCGSDVTNIGENDKTTQWDTKVVKVALSGKSGENENQVEDLFSTIQEQSSGDYVVLYTSSAPKEIKRSVLAQRAPSDKPAIKLPIFAKYQLFSPAIFMGLAVALLFIFIAGIGITWLVGIQTPLRFEGKQKKN